MACLALFQKILRFRRRANHLYKLAPSRPAEGRFAIVTNVGGMRWTRQRWRANGVAGQVLWACERSSSTQTNGACCGRRSRVVLTPRRWRQVLWRCICPTGFEMYRQIREATVAKEPGRRGEHEASR